MIFFVCLYTNTQVYAQALGFTNTVMYFAEAETKDQAGQKARNYFESRYKIGARVSSVSVALRQDRKRYYFPEYIL